MLWAHKGYGQGIMSKIINLLLLFFAEPDFSGFLYV